jgi:hypothetical protein
MLEESKISGSQAVFIVREAAHLVHARRRRPVSLPLKSQRSPASNDKTAAPLSNAHIGCHANIARQPARPNHDTKGDVSRCAPRSRNAARFVTEYQVNVKTLVKGMTFRRSNVSDASAQHSPMSSTVRCGVRKRIVECRKPVRQLVCLAHRIADAGRAQQVAGKFA